MSMIHYLMFPKEFENSQDSKSWNMQFWLKINTMALINQRALIYQNGDEKTGKTQFVEKFSRNLISELNNILFLFKRKQQNIKKLWI